MLHFRGKYRVFPIYSEKVVIGLPPSLLEYLMGLFHCEFLSDLHYVVPMPSELQVFRDLPEDAFSLSEYREALTYLLGPQIPSLESCQQAKELLLQALEQDSLRQF